MRLAASAVVLLLPAVCAAADFSYHVAGDDGGAWPQILSSIGLTTGVGQARVFVVRDPAPGTAAKWLKAVEAGAIVIVEGESELAEAAGIRATKKHVEVRSITDTHAPQLPIIWEKAVMAPVFEVPRESQVFASERWQHAPLETGLRIGKGALLWVAVPPGEKGYERFPYLPQAMGDLGLDPPFRSRGLWAFFDWSYRTRVDVDYFAARWRKSGIGALHVAGWHFYEPEQQRDAYLSSLIEACHRNAIVVYVWLELPHVSDRFWADHPEWREKTALLQDAQLDWRKLMNLSNPAASAAVRTGVRSLVNRFDWDGVNLAELYFESLEGTANPARFTPMNDDVRAEFRSANGWDPIDLFQAAPMDEKRRKTFLDFRAELARKQQVRWISEIEDLRRTKPNLDLVLTHVDDRFDTRMRESIGADVARLLPLLDEHNFTFLVEDPATVWNLGPQRYPQIASRYKPLTGRQDKLAIDINIVDRYQDVYPTKQQTGTELFQLVHLATQSFAQVALYFENSILAPDQAFLPAAAAGVTRLEETGTKLNVATGAPVGIHWPGPAAVDGKIWPVRDSQMVWLPAGVHSIETAETQCEWQVQDFNGKLTSAKCNPNGVELAYESNSRSLARLKAKPARLEIDGAPTNPDFTAGTLTLPRGQHIAAIFFR